MFKLLVATNLLGCLVAAIVATRGEIMLAILAIGVFVVFVSPMVVFGYIWLQSLAESLFPNGLSANSPETSNGNSSPFDD